MMEPVAIWGAGVHASVVADAIRCEGRHVLAGFFDSQHPERKDEAFLGSRVLGGTGILLNMAAQGLVRLVPGIGACDARLRLIEMTDRMNVELASALHPTAIIASGVPVGVGTVAMAGAIVNAESSIGRAVILNTACSVDHHCQIEDGVHIAPGARLGGTVRVGRGAWIGIGAVIREGITIGAHAIVGAGTVVIRHVAAGQVVVGNPARVLRQLPLGT